MAAIPTPAIQVNKSLFGSPERTDNGTSDAMFSMGRIDSEKKRKR
jgi:hypothetical protein